MFRLLFSQSVAKISHFLQYFRVLKNDIDPLLSIRQRIFPITFSKAILNGKDLHSTLKGHKERHLTCINESSRHTPNSLYALHQECLQRFFQTHRKIHTFVNSNDWNCQSSWQMKTHRTQWYWPTTKLRSKRPFTIQSKNQNSSKQINSFSLNETQQDFPAQNKLSVGERMPN